jgi:hypothetical protein
MAVDSHAADIAIGTNGIVYVFYLKKTTGAGGITNVIQYNWITTNGALHGPMAVQSHANSAYHFSMNDDGNGYLKRSNASSNSDYFDSNGFPRVTVNRNNGNIYLVYADQPAPGTNVDRGDIWIQEGVVTNSDGSLKWSGAIKVNNDRTLTDQWNPSVAVNPSGTELFVGYYSRESDSINNATIKAYGAKANLANGLTNSTFDSFPISTVGFTNLFWGTSTNIPNDRPWLTDAVWVPQDLGMDSYARIVDINSVSNVFSPTGTFGGYQHFTSDDYTWANADSGYFYFAWRDCSDLCTNKWVWNNLTNSYIRADPNIRIGKVAQ